MAGRENTKPIQRHSETQGKDWEDYPAPLLLPPVSKNTLETEPEGRTKSLPFTSSLLLSLPPLPRSIHTPVQPAAPKEPEPEKGLKRRHTAQGPPCAAARGRDLGTDRLPNCPTDSETDAVDRQSGTWWPYSESQWNRVDGRRASWVGLVVL